MGILNLDPSSFYKPSIALTILEGLQRVEKMIEEGMNILDLGAFSSRPGAQIPDEITEQNRLLPILKEIKRNFPELALSIDTVHSTTAHKALDLGADIINDISGGLYDHMLPQIVAKYHKTLIVMHMQGLPSTMMQSSNTTYTDVCRDLILFFQGLIKKYTDLGLYDLIIDPGFGFSKSLSDNYKLLRGLESFQILEKPLLIGVSRKSMIWKTLQTSSDEALSGSLTAMVYAVLKGAQIVRVHDVRETCQALKILNLLQSN